MKRKINFARIHYSWLFWFSFEKDIFKDLLKIKNQDGFIYCNDYYYCISELYNENIDWYECIVWIITKVIPKEQKESIDKHTKEVKEIINEYVKNNESMFLILPSKNLIWFITSKTLTKNQFFSAFKQAFFINNFNYEPEFKLIYDEDYLVELLNRLVEVKFAKFDLYTTNPDSREDFKKIDDLFQATKSYKNKIILNSKKWKWESLDFKNKDSLIRQWLAMSSSWYWWWEIQWINQEWNYITIKTADRNIKEVEITNTQTVDEVKRKIIIVFINIINNHK